MQEKRDLVAERARATFNAIRELRKGAPQFTRQQREDLAEGIKKLQDCWWEDVRELFVKGVDDPNYPPFTERKREIFRKMNGG